MNDIVERVLSSVDPSVGFDARAKVRSYIFLLASTGETHRQLEHLSKAYLRETAHPPLFGVLRAGY
jgi:hypothetical protein